MYPYLKQHAIENVWCNEDQDNQHILKLAHVSKVSGEINRIRFLSRNITLPNPGKYYHVYQIGQMKPGVLGLLTNEPFWLRETWTSFSKAMIDREMIADIYNEEGVSIPRYQSYYMLTYERDLIVAIEVNSNIPVSLGTEALYIRVYSNAYFQLNNPDSINDLGFTPRTDNELSIVNQNYAAYSLNPGKLNCYRNGMLVETLSKGYVKIGDTVEMVIDTTIDTLVEWPLDKLLTFDSTLDNKYKYLLHYDTDAGNFIRYLDDIDLHIVHKSGNGLYFHKNSVDAVRMVTHRDYSIPVNYVKNTLDALQRILKLPAIVLSEFKVVLTIRKAGNYQHHLIHDNNRIFELYKLSPEQRLAAMVGVDATVPEWQAANLEASGYCELMRAHYKDINMALIQRAYGYNSISRIVGDSPFNMKVMDSIHTKALPYVLAKECTVYEYDDEGMLEYHYRANGQDYVTSNISTTKIEAIVGHGTQVTDVVYGKDDLSLPTVDNYRVYMTVSKPGEVETWVDITGDEYYKVESGKLKWTNYISDYLLMVRTDKTFLAYDVPLKPVAGTFYFTLSEYTTRDGLAKHRTLPVPMGELDLFMNGKSLIWGLDYVVKFPTIYIINKSFLNQNSIDREQTIHVRYTGFCNTDLSNDAIDDFGWVEHGFLSNNNRFDIRDDKVLRITMNGKLFTRDEVLFSEEHTGVSVVNAINGKPYQVKDVVVPLKGCTDEDTYSLRSKSLEIDKRVSDYMTLHLPQPTRDAVSAIDGLYPLYSPFFTHIVNDMVTNLIDNTTVKSVKSDQDVLTFCKSYEWLLAYDPVNLSLSFDTRWVKIHPHSLSLTVNITETQYSLLEKIMRLYGNDRIEISHFISFTPGS